MDADPAELLNVAYDAALEAGRFLIERRPRDLGVARTKSSPTDVVTEMDTGAERLLIEYLLGARPGDAVLGEEGGDRVAADGGASGVRWVIDPIDGTVNYLYDLPAWAVSVAAEMRGTVVAGVVHAPATGHTYTAVLGGGAQADGHPLQVGAGAPIAEALVATGFGYAAGRRARQAAVIAGLLGQVRDIRRVGSAALDLCTVATGQVDAYFERGTNYWDHAAGGLVASEAGAVVGGLRGAAAATAMVLAAPPGLFGPLHDLLVDLRADED